MNALFLKFDENHQPTEANHQLSPRRKIQRKFCQDTYTYSQIAGKTKINGKSYKHSEKNRHITGNNIKNDFWLEIIQASRQWLIALNFWYKNFSTWNYIAIENVFRNWKWNKDMPR